MEVFAHPFSLPKAGNSATEYEDAVWPTRKLRVRKGALCLAVADGATETSYSGVWAKQLVRAFARGRLRAATIVSDLGPLQERWWKAVQQKPLPWYAEEKLRSGTFAALLGLSLFAPAADESSGRWRSLAVGDCCLVQVRREEVLAAFPINSATEFQNRPCLLSTNSTDNARVEEYVQTLEGSWTTDDTFFLMTDALAHWFYLEMERGERPWATMRDLDTHDEVQPFASWIAKLRSEPVLRNDDVTLLRVDVA